MLNEKLPRSTMDSLNYTLPYGIYRGKSLKDIWLTDKRYVYLIAKYWKFDHTTVNAAVTTAAWFSQNTETDLMRYSATN